jgi:lipoate-protein ligase A
MQVRLIITQPANGFKNMAIDEAILIHGRPTLRFYGWQPACISVGYFQNIRREINIESCRHYGLDIVRRPTGGKAVLHEHELTYSLSIPENVLGGGVRQSYQAISRVLATALQNIGIPVQARAQGEPYHRSPLCFQAVSFYELVLNGKKVVGSAQTRKNGTLLQHGSILLDVDYEKLSSCLRSTSTHTQASDLVRSLTGINRECPNQFTVNQLQNTIANCFNNELGFSLQEEQLTEEELETALELEKDKYASSEWNFKLGGVPA